MNRLAKLFLNKSERQVIDGLKQMQGTIPIEYLLSTMSSLTKTAPVWIGDDRTKYIEEAFDINHIVYTVVMRQAEMFAKAEPELWDCSKEEKQKIEDHPILEILDNPNPMMDGKQYAKLNYAFKRVTGNQYELGFRPDVGSNEGLIQQLYVLPPQYIDIISGGLFEPIQGYRNRFNTSVEFAAENVLHTKYINLDYDTSGTHLYGMSPLKPGGRVVTVSNDQYTTEAKLLQNVGAIGSFTPKDVYEKYTIDSAATFKENFNSITGPSNRGKTFWPNIPLEWQQVAMSAVDLALNDSKKMTKRELCDLLDYPSDLLNDPERNKFDSIREAKKSAWNKVISDLDSQYTGYNQWLVPAYAEKENKKLKLEYSLSHIPELQADKKEQTEWLNMAWWFEPNRKREIMGEPRLENPIYDDIWAPANIFPMSDMSTDSTEFEKAYKEWQDSTVKK
jgi:HK97 family phage portal protein